MNMQTHRQIRLVFHEKRVVVGITAPVVGFMMQSQRSVQWLSKTAIRLCEQDFLAVSDLPFGSVATMLTLYQMRLDKMMT